MSKQTLPGKQKNVDKYENTSKQKTRQMEAPQQSKLDHEDTP